MRNIVHVLEGCISYLNMFSIISKTKTNRFFESYPKERIFDMTENGVMEKGAALRAGARSAMLVSCKCHVSFLLLSYSTPRLSDNCPPASVCLCNAQSAMLVSCKCHVSFLLLSYSTPRLSDNCPPASVCLCNAHLVQMLGKIQS